MGDAGGDVGLQVDVAPDLHGADRRAHLFGPVPELERGGDAEAGDAAALLVVEPVFEFLDARGDEVEDFIRQRIGIGPVQLHADAADEIHQHQIGAAPAHL